MSRRLVPTASMQHTACIAAQVLLSVVEIYCERIQDLLAPGSVPSSAGDNLAVQQDRERGVFIAGATEVSLTRLWPTLTREADQREWVHALVAIAV